MQFMVIETFKHGPEPVYARFRQHGRMAPEGLEYVTSVVTADGMRCYQTMRCDDRRLLDEWISRWNDLVDCEVIPVVSSAEAAQRYGPK
jgi:hypothetical protein